MPRRLNVFLTLHREKGQNPVVRCEGLTDSPLSFQANKTGCRNLGEIMFDKGVEEWTCSSSMDFPEEEGCKIDLHRFIWEGWQAANEKKEKPRQLVLARMFEFCAGKTFQCRLTPEQKQIFVTLREEIVKN